jgi:hypothetical protein
MMQVAQEEGEKKVVNAERETKMSRRRMKRNFEQKFKEVTRALQTKLPDERIKRSIYFLAISVLTVVIETGFAL